LTGNISRKTLSLIWFGPEGNSHFQRPAYFDYVATPGELLSDEAVGSSLEEVSYV